MQPFLKAHQITATWGTGGVAPRIQEQLCRFPGYPDQACANRPAMASLAQELTEARRRGPSALMWSQYPAF